MGRLFQRVEIDDARQGLQSLLRQTKDAQHLNYAHTSHLEIVRAAADVHGISRSLSFQVVGIRDEFNPMTEGHWDHFVLNLIYQDCEDHGLWLLDKQGRPVFWDPWNHPSRPRMIAWNRVPEQIMNRWVDRLVEFGGALRITYWLDMIYTALRNYMVLGIRLMDLQDYSGAAYTLSIKRFVEKVSEAGRLQILNGSSMDWSMYKYPVMFENMDAEDDAEMWRQAAEASIHPKHVMSIHGPLNNNNRIYPVINYWARSDHWCEFKDPETRKVAVAIRNNI